jgi:hypothetical protein
MSDSPIHKFCSNTKMMCLAVSIALFLIMITVVAPGNLNGFAVGTAKLAAVGLLGYALLNNVTETTKLLSSIPNVLTSADSSSVRNNAILNYVLSAVMAVLILYVLYTLVV